MKTGLIILSLILICSVFFPIYLLNKAGKKNDKKMKRQFKQAAAFNALHIDEYEHWGNTYIGVDYAQKKILFLKSLEPEYLIQLIDLIMVKNCHIIRSIRQLKVKDRKENILENLSLELSFIGNDKANFELNFYDENSIYREDFEDKRAEKWEKIIKNLIKIKKSA